MGEPLQLETERLILRMFRESDLDGFAEMCADEIVMRYIGTGKTLSREEAWREMAIMLGHWELRGYGLWAVEERESHSLIGRIGCWNPEGWPGFEVGWMLRRQSWGHGLATEGVRAALNFAFSTLQRPHVISLICADNAKSIRLALRVGERLEGEAEALGTKFLVYGIDCETWAKIRT